MSDCTDAMLSILELFAPWRSAFAVCCFLIRFRSFAWRASSGPARELSWRFSATARASVRRSSRSRRASAVRVPSRCPTSALRSLRCLTSSPLVVRSQAASSLRLRPRLELLPQERVQPLDLSSELVGPGHVSGHQKLRRRCGNQRGRPATVRRAASAAALGGIGSPSRRALASRLGVLSFERGELRLQRAVLRLKGRGVCLQPRPVRGELGLEVLSVTGSCVGASRSSSRARRRRCSGGRSRGRASGSSRAAFGCPGRGGGASSSAR